MPNHPIILAVDSNRRNLELLMRFIGGEGYQVHGAANIAEFDQALDELEKIGLVVLDLAGFDRSIWDRCERLRDAKMPFLVISPRQSLAIRQEGMSHGAHNMLVKPLTIKELLGMIRTLLEE